tara:strand:+ start:309 stop:782 length:474 start_codon:yes stop_codon:yes gene_type:complete
MPSKKKRKRRRDPARPKRAMTPFLYYACEQRRVLKASGEKLTLPEQSRRIAALWQDVTDKSSYIAQSNADRERYAAEMREYTPPVRIKRPRSSYAFFMRDIRQSLAAKHPDKNPRELMVEIAAAWRTANVQQREHYASLAEADKKRYADEKSTESSI